MKVQEFGGTSRGALVRKMPFPRGNISMPLFTKTARDSYLEVASNELKFAAQFASIPELIKEARPGEDKIPRIVNLLVGNHFPLELLVKFRKNDYPEATISLLNKIRPKLNLRFKDLPDEELIVSGIFLVARKPE